MFKAIPFEVETASRSTRIYKLFFGIAFDLIGILPSIFPPFAIVWAPLSAVILLAMYKGRIGKIAGVFDFVEELFPVIDFIPTFTLTWFYIYVIKARK